jgi:uncharacterized protein YlxW (UPF0749 family)
MPSDQWTDERLDDLAATLRPLPEEVAKVAQAVEHLTSEIKGLREESREDSKELRDNLAANQRLQLQLAVGMIFALVAAVTALIVALV